MLYIIDGYNLLRFVQKNIDGNSGTTDVSMCRLFSYYLQIKKESGIVVFDGIGPPDKTALNNIDLVEVVFSGKNTEADDVIEDLICQYSAPKRLVVISDDRRIILQAKKRKSIHKNCVNFWLDIQTAIDKKQKSNHEPPQKRNGISETETKLWLKEFGL